MTIKTYANDGQLTFPEMDNNWAELEAGMNSRQRKHGFEVGADGARLATIAYNSATRVLTITPTATSFTFYIDGVKFTKTGVQTATAHAADSGRYFYYYDDEGNIQISTTPWSIVDRTVTPAAFVFYNHSIAKGIPMVELHGADRWLEGHKNLHFTQGTRRLSGFGLSGFSLNTDTDDAVKFGVATGQIADEDLVTVVSALADGGPYTVFYRTGANGDWTWDSTPTYPFLAGATYPQYNQNTGVTWQMTELSGVGSGTWCNYFLFAVPSVDAATQLLLVPGQTQHASLSAAQAEGVSGIAWGTMPFEEIAPLYKITLHARSTYTNTYNVEIVGVTEILAGGASVITSSSPSVHNALSSRDADDTHPAASITNTPYGGLTATTVQGAINELDDNKLETSIYDAHANVLSLDVHPATAISFYDPIYVSENVSDAISETYGFINQHAGTITDAHDASAISYAGGTGMSATNVEAAIDELANEKVSKDANGSVGLGTTTLPAAPTATHMMIAPGGLFGVPGGTVYLSENTFYESGWKYVATAAASLYQLTGGVAGIWTAPSGTAGNPVTFTKRFEVSAGYIDSMVEHRVTGGALQVTGSSTPTGTGGVEVQYSSSVGYVQAYDRGGGAWKDLYLRGLTAQLWAAGYHKGGVDSNGMYGVALSKAGDPDTTDIPSSVWRVCKNTSSGAVKLWYNDGGVLKSVALA
jgi:hypothetical protein